MLAGDEIVEQKDRNHPSLPCFAATSEAAFADS
jgi:hypothetical protein